nr:glycylpeptide N-tetradecanoyltransferase [Cryptococcus depauperatus CBS 7855]
MPTDPSESLPVKENLSPNVEEVLDKFQQLGQAARMEANAKSDGEDENSDGEGDSDGGDAEKDKSNVEGSSNDKKKKKKKKKSKATKAVQKLKDIATGKASDEIINVVREHMDPAESRDATDEEIRRALKAADLMKILDGKMALGNKSGTKNLGEHKFWKTQPVPQMLGSSSSSVLPLEEGPIDQLKAPADVRQEPINLPSGFEWSTIDIKNEEQASSVYVLLSENYVEDDDAMFRFNYSKEFLLWALTPPGYFPDWHIGVRVAKTKKLVGFISGVRVDIRARKKSFPGAEINFLCVHKKLRSKRLAPVLIKEVTRRVNSIDIWQAIYTAGVVIPTPVGTSRYFHRNLNPPKLVDIGFSPLARGTTVARLVQQYSIPAHPSTPGFREMAIEDVPQVRRLLQKYLSRFELAQKFESDEEVAHWFLSGQGREMDGKRIEQVIWAFVVEDPVTHLITDFVSFYSLPSTIMKHPKHNLLNAAYMFYYASDVLFSAGGSSDDAATHDAKGRRKLERRLNELVGDLLVMAKIASAQFDVFNALTLLDNNMFLQEQKFGPGDGFLNYYLYNWNCAPVDGGHSSTSTKKSSQIGFVLL